MIAPGVKALSTYVGHANISITLDLYGNLMPGSEDEAAGLLDAYLARSDSQARVAEWTSSPAFGPSRTTASEGHGCERESR